MPVAARGRDDPAERRGDAKFLTDPKGFLQSNAVSNKFSLGKSAKTSIDLDKSWAKVVMDLLPLDKGLGLLPATRFEASYGVTSATCGKGDWPIVGAWVPYHSEGDVSTGKAALGTVKIATNPGPSDPKFVFTGAMNGCSLLIATDANQNLYAVHYPNSTGSQKGFPLLTGANLTLVKSIDYEGQNGYGEDRNELESLPKTVWSNAFCCLHHHNGQWRILGQSQLVSPKGKQFVTRINPVRGVIEA